MNKSKQPLPTDTGTLRAAIRVARIILIAAFVVAGFYFFLAWQLGAWQLYVLGSVITAFCVVNGIGLRMIQQNRMDLGVWTILVGMYIVFPVASMLVADIGLIFAGAVVILAYVVASQAFPPKQLRWALLISLASALITAATDLIDLEYRLFVPEIQVFIPVITGAIILVVLYLIVRQAWSASIRIRLVTTFVALVVVSLGSVTFIVNRSVQARFQDTIGANFETLADDQLGQINDFFLEKVSQLQVLSGVHFMVGLVEENNAAYDGSEAEILAQIRQQDEAWIAAPDDDPFVQQIITPDPVTNPAAEALADFLDDFPDHTELILTDRYGANVATSARTSDYYQGDEEWWQAAWNDGEGALYISQPEYDQSADVTALLVAMPVQSELTGEPVGVLRSTLVVDSVYELIAQIQIGQSGHAVLWDRTGTILFDPREETVNSAGLPYEAIAHIFEGNEHEHNDEAAPHYDIFQDQNGSEIISAHATLQPLHEGEEQAYVAYLSPLQEEIVDKVANLGWTVMLRQKTAEAFAAVGQITRIILLVTAIVVVVTLFATYALAQFLVAPVVSLTEVAERFAAGDLDARAEVQTEDELGTLADTFNTMAAELRTTLDTLEQRVADRTRALETSTEVSRRLSTILDQDLLVREVVEQLQAAFGYYHAHIYLYDDTKQTLLMAGGTGDAGRTMLARGHSIERGRGLVGRAAETGEPVLVPDTSQAEGWLPNPLLPETRAEVAVPIIIGDDVLGVLDVQHNLIDGLGEEDADLIQAIANQVAVALQNAQAYERTQRQAEREAQTASLNQRIQSTTTIDEVLKIAVAELGQALNVKRANVELKLSDEALQSPADDR